VATADNLDGVDMSARKLVFEGADGNRLAARLELPVGEEPIAYALFAHCFTCSKDLKAAVNVSRALASRRIGVFRFDFTGLGESAGDFADTNFSSNVGDLLYWSAIKRCAICGVPLSRLPFKKLERCPIAKKATTGGAVAGGSV